MRPVAAYLVATTMLAALACTPEGDVGCTPEQRARGECISDLPTSAPPPSTTRPPTTRPPTTRPPSTPPPPVTPQGRTWQMVIRDSANGYDPHDLRLRVGDTIVFTNHDANSDHTFTADKGQWDSGRLSQGEKFTLKIDLPPGKYTFHCEVVPYVLGGPIEVLPRA